MRHHPSHSSQAVSSQGGETECNGNHRHDQKHRFCTGVRRTDLPRCRCAREDGLASNKTPQWLGEISYGFYLFQVVALFTMQKYAAELQGHEWATYIIAIALTLALAGLSYRFIETPIRNVVKRRSKTTTERQPSQQTALPSPSW